MNVEVLVPIRISSIFGKRKFLLFITSAFFHSPYKQMIIESDSDEDYFNLG